MSYAFINIKRYKSGSVNNLYRHIERKNNNYSNQAIDLNKTHLNYSLKECNKSYTECIKDLKEKYNLQGGTKSNSNVICEYVVTSDQDYFKRIGKEETKRFFLESYNFLKSYKGLNECYIISATIHMDETTPHMHLVYIPVVRITKDNNTINKICASTFWQGRDSYKSLQDDYYSYITKCGFEFERNSKSYLSNLTMKKYKELTCYDMQEMSEEIKTLETEVNSNDINVIRSEYKRVIQKFNTLARRCIRVKAMVNDMTNKTEGVKKENEDLKNEIFNLKEENKRLNTNFSKTKEWIEIVTDLKSTSIDHLLDNFLK